MTEPSSPTPRRTFFRETLAKLVGPLADYLEPGTARVPVRRNLRPPGAIEEPRFLDTCQRCGACVAACPAGAIQWHESAADDRAHHTPVVQPSVTACVVCEGLLCTHACPSGALLPLTAPGEISMGLAVVNESDCVRGQGETCTACVDLCPLGAAAIHFPDEGAPAVLTAGCTGCGVCEQHCPANPKAIVVHAW